MLDRALACVLRQLTVALPPAVVSLVAEYSHSAADRQIVTFLRWCTTAAAAAGMAFAPADMPLCPVDFETGRGLMATEPFPPPSAAAAVAGGVAGATSTAPVLLAIPEPLLVTPSKVRASARLRPVFARAAAIGLRLSDETALSLWLCAERRAGGASKWAPYIAVLPADYSTLVWWSDELIGRHFPTTIAEQLTATARKCVIHTPTRTARHGTTRRVYSALRLCV
jgi:hypothetical protein